MSAPHASPAPLGPPGAGAAPDMLRSMLGALALLFLFAALATAQDVDDCLGCHEDEDLWGERNGEEIHVFVDWDEYEASAHGDQDCIACHMDLLDMDMFHAEDLLPARCDTCHAVQQVSHAKSLHGQALARGDEMAPSCADCHGNHDILSHRVPDSRTAILNIPQLCGTCHHEGSPVSITHDIPQDHILENYSLSIHGEGLFKKGLSVTAVCTSCHTSHDILPHTDPASTIHPDNVATTCTACHAQIETVHRKVIEGRLWEEEPNLIPACVDCHSPHKARRVFYPAGMSNKDCMTCHARQDLSMTRDGEQVPLYVDEIEYGLSMHSETACAQCHADATVSLTRPCETITQKVDCSVCHADQVQQYEGSTHGVLHAGGDEDAPTCMDCHADHATQGRGEDTSPTFPRNVPELCSSCHREGGQAAERIHADVDDIAGSYDMSIHGQGLTESGLLVTATCVSCHTAHGELPPDDPGSTVHTDNIADTCGECHHGIEEAFKRGVHWRENGDVDPDVELPACNDCHTSHTISRTDREDFRLVMMDQCGRCHDKEAETFFDTFHGKASRLGSAEAAKCYDCHGTHEILPPSNPASTLGRDNVVETCAQCHEGAHRQFAGYLTHATHHDADTYPWLFWSFWAMTTLLIGTLAFALLHTLFWLVRLWLSRDEWKKHKEAAAARKGQKLYRRFTRFQRVLHMVMMLSFFLLALTGMALKFSYMGWAQFISRTLGGSEAMGVLHRMGAIALIIVFAMHLANVARKRREAKKTWKQMLTGPETIMFRKQDLRDFMGSVKWFFGLGPRPKFGRWTYWEKFDYFAVFWGVFVIGMTGLILWFPELFTRIVPGWFVNVATIIHSDEALLAVGFIFTVHFFNTHFRPDKFPMDTVMFTGRVTLDELKYDKPGEYERLASAGTLESQLVDPFPRVYERSFRIFGFVMLGIGLALIAMIVYAMLFGYR